MPSSTIRRRAGRTSPPRRAWWRRWTSTGASSGRRGRQRHRASGGARVERGGEDLLHVAPHLGRAESLDGPAVPHAREEIGHAVLLVQGQRGGLERLASVSG